MSQEQRAPRDIVMLHTDLAEVSTDALSYVNEPISVGHAAQADALVLMQCVLEQMDYGLALVHTRTWQIRFANRLAHASMRAANGQGSGLCVLDGRLSTVLPTDAEQLENALCRAQSGVRALISLGGKDHTTSVAVVPLTAPNTQPYALLVFAKQQLCDSSTVALFARERGLTGAESNVLASICSGKRPAEIASQLGVQISTVRSQLRSIRVKTRCDTIRQLVETVSILPPMARHMPTSTAH